MIANVFPTDLKNVPTESPEEHVHVLIAFDDDAAYQRAMRVLASVTAGELGVRPLPWQFDRLESREWRPLADLEATRAEIIVIATTSTAELTPAATAWLRHALEGKRGTPTIVVALFGAPGEEDDSTSARLQFVQRLAEEAGLPFLAPAFQPATVLAARHESIWALSPPLGCV
jgi:hypothetical protein